MVQAEFDRQIENLLEKGYPQLMSLSESEFVKGIEPLRLHLDSFSVDEIDLDKGSVPFVIVINSLAPDRAIQLVERRKKQAFTVLESEDMKGFKPIEGLDIPDNPAYLMFDIDRGNDTLNIIPNEAMKMMQADNRCPLTIEEGIALVTHFPDILKKSHGFSLLGSRCGDKRVTALWISDGKPKLGWCWAGNPHTWLGSASCAGRIGC